MYTLVMESGSSLKDALFNKKSVEYLADLFVTTYPSFDKKGFISNVMNTLHERELKQRIVWIAECLEKYLPIDFKETSKIIARSLPVALDPAKTDDDFGEFILAPLGEYVVRNGLSKKDLKISLKTLREITMRFSMEDAMRSFLNTWPDETLAEYGKWVNDKNYHVRRLVSESSRPMLPWSCRLTLSYTIPLPLLDILYADNTRYVTRSVANHLNDISKKDPELVIQTLTRWQKEGKQDETEMNWIAKHSLRTLIKKGNKNALKLLGYHHDNEVVVDKFILHTKQISMGGVLSFSFEIRAQEKTNVMIDYVIDFVKASGGTKGKVFKLKKMTLLPGELVQITKIHKLKTEATTFKMYPGKHAVTLQINGQKFETIHFNLI